KAGKQTVIIAIPTNATGEINRFKIISKETAPANTLKISKAAAVKVNPTNFATYNTNNWMGLPIGDVSRNSQGQLVVSLGSGHFGNTAELNFFDKPLDMAGFSELQITVNSQKAGNYKISLEDQGGGNIVEKTIHLNPGEQ